MDGLGTDGLRRPRQVGRLPGRRGQAPLRGPAPGAARGRRRSGSMDDALTVAGADAVTLVLAAATNFVNYKDVSADPAARVGATLKAVAGQAVSTRMRAAHVARAPAAVPARGGRRLPRDSEFRPAHRRAAEGLRRRERSGPGGPRLPVRPLPAHLVVAARARSRPTCRGSGTRTMNPMWDAKYTTNINTADELLAGRGRRT